MSGSKEIRTQLKKANGKMVDVTGRIHTGRRALVKGKKMGKNTFVVGTTQGTTSPMEEQAVSDATIDVDSVEIVGGAVTRSEQRGDGCDSFGRAYSRT